ncbi:MULTISPECIES: glycoside hydrolase family 88 protein [unclassified Acidovorax]|uniref:glycoside hydrolase family 88 protein n=1 Tax=unclassified Acidovorax TaxID=2684926 RepID=UPI000B406957|nr:MULTISPECIES: glycoside hydrolase family 88 protein [unclassified Acidovorax]MBU4422567.1 glycoside hydrolase family 88 protein [Gammaproteobacteria bacterium]
MHHQGNQAKNATGASQLAYGRLQKIANLANSNPYENKSILSSTKERILNSLGWRLSYRLSVVSPYENWYLAASLWPLLIESKERPLQAEILKKAIDKQLDHSGAWKYPLNTAFKFLMCTHVVRLWELTGEERYLKAATDAFSQLKKMKRASNGAFLYLPTRDEVLVDTLGMICPFLGACAKSLNIIEAGDLLREQLELYWKNNMDAETGLPFHGYYAGGPNKLGNLGWGRGVGWYMLAMAAAQSCMKPDTYFAEKISDWHLRILQTLITNQRTDGHWSEFILIKSRADSSATSMIILSLTTERQEKKVGIDKTSNSLEKSIQAARLAILRSTERNGLIQHATGEAPALGSYSHAHGNYPWAQGFGTAALAQSSQWLSSH